MWKRLFAPKKNMDLAVFVSPYGFLTWSDDSEELKVLRRKVCNRLSEVESALNNKPWVIGNTKKMQRVDGILWPNKNEIEVIIRGWVNRNWRGSLDDFFDNKTNDALLLEYID